MAALAIADLRCGFERKLVLNGVTLAVPAGQLTCILGASGSGKTTLLRMIGGFGRPDGGSVVIDGQMVAGDGVFVPPERRRVGYVAQDGALFPHLSVAANVLFGLPRADRTASRAEALLALVGLSAEYAARPPQELSGGEQQRVALARALAPKPRLVLLDEPFSALDAALRVETRLAVLAALANVGATAVMVTHDQGEALSMAQEVAVLRDGVLVQVARPTELYRHPADRDLAQFVGEAMLLPGIAAAATVQCALGRLDRADHAGASRDGAVDVLLRPEQLVLLPADSSHCAGAVAQITYYGHDANIRLAMDAGSGLPDLTVRVSGHAVPGIGERRCVRVDGAVVTYPR